MALKLVFIGRNTEQTSRYFKEFLEANKEQVRILTYHDGASAPWRSPRSAQLKDGTMIYRAPSSLDRLDGLRIDQVIVACDHRGVYNWPESRLALLQELIHRAAMSDRILDQDRVIIYELNEQEA